MILRNYVGLFIVALSTLMYEILLTRIFSITLLYHFAFMVISVGMFGMTFGAIIVYLLPHYFGTPNTQMQLASNSLLLGLSTAVSFFCYTKMPILMHMLHLHELAQSIIHLLCACLLAGIPFTFSGIVVCLALTKLSQPINNLYAADLVGASLGCLLLLPLLNYFDGASAVFFIAALPCFAGFLFAPSYKSKVFKLTCCLFALGLISISCINTNLVSINQAFIRVPEKNAELRNERIYERWNSFSRILVHGNAKVLHRPLAWGLSSNWPQDKKISELNLAIDSNAHTPLAQFNGNWHDVDYLQHDVVNAVHQIKHNADIGIIGAGGGRDVLSSLFFHQKRILAIEINNIILDCLTRIFGNYTGHLDRYPEVTLVNDEARSFLTRSKQKFDIIQISLVDSFSATASGAFVFTENCLYTTEAWAMFMQHLKPDGVLSVSYWYEKGTGIDIELYRFLALSVSTLKNLGVEDCRKNIIVIANLDTKVATILVSKKPFSEQDLSKIDSFATDNKFSVVLSPQKALDNSLAQIASAKDLKSVIDNSPINLIPPTDDCPFFFHVIKSNNMLKLFPSHQAVGREYQAILILQSLIIIMILACFICIFFPLLLTTVRVRMHWRSIVPHLIYFGSIGLGFMFIEISQLEKLIVFLGHPIYGFSIVLFTLLLGSGIGSYCIAIWNRYPAFNKPVIWLGAMLIVMSLFGCLTSTLIPFFRDGSMLARISLSIIILFPLGFFMGMAFPIGMILSKRSFEFITPWLWGVNGAASVCASVLALAVSLTCGLSATFWTGFAFYCIALLSYLWASSKSREAA